MPFLSAFLLMAQTAQAGQIEVPLANRRPSTVVAGIKGLGGAFVPYDDRGTVGVWGTPREIENAKQYLRLIDTPRQPLLMRITVSSPVDHLTWEVDARLTSGQKWRTSDEETGTDILLEPRVDASGNLNVVLVAKCRNAKIQSSFRMVKGGSKSLDLGADGVQVFELGPDEKVSVKQGEIALPKITVRYVGG